ncbi:hypothetical protein ACIBH1_38105 [Nonomuraea sp. NPDC050663]|uniref:hypothetical protein n=1 Tax=Nonomuraea sp. NPDC050663 TaxID=3364370 RepID=UPI00378B7909
MDTREEVVLAVDAVAHPDAYVDYDGQVRMVERGIGELWEPYMENVALFADLGNTRDGLREFQFMDQVK